MRHTDEHITSGSHTTPWFTNVQPAPCYRLTENIETEVVIVGAGIAGLSVAYCLAVSGRKVVVIEDGEIGSGESGRTTAHLVTALDDRYYELERIHGRDATKLAAQSHTAAIDFIEHTMLKENIDCDFERLTGYLFRHPSDKKNVLNKEFDAASNAGLPVTMIDSVPGIPSEKEGCIAFNGQAQFHILKYLNGLCRVIGSYGGQVYTNTHAAQIDRHGIVTDTGINVKAQHVVVATNTPVNDLVSIHTKQTPYRTYVIGARVKRGLVPQALWWDTGDRDINAAVPPYHYVRLQTLGDGYDLLICGGEDHVTGKPGDTWTEEDRYKRLEGWASHRFPVEEVLYRWSGQVMEPMDGLGYIGRNPGDENVYVASGDSGNGMTHGTIAGLLISDLINGKNNAWESLYNPSRFRLMSGGTYIKDNLAVMVAFFKRRLTDPEIRKVGDIKTGDASVLNIDNDLYGIYRDEQQNLHMVSAVCPHLKCTVVWNSDEKSWDCPCHGSRFTYTGKVMNGPANRDLEYQVVMQDNTPIALDN